MTSRTDTERIASRIADDLLTNGAGERGDRLVITSSEGKDLGGWCWSAVRDRIRSAIDAAMEGDDATSQEH